MAKPVPPLSQTKVHSSKPKEKLYKLSDGGGLALWIFPSGLKSWRFEYRRRDQKRDTITIGRYPEVGLSDARKKRDEYRSTIANGGDPKVTDEEGHIGFNEVATMWLERRKAQVTPDYLERMRQNLALNIPSKFGGMDIKEIKPMDVVRVLSVLEGRGVFEQLNRLKQVMRNIYEFAISRGLCEYNPIASIGNNAFEKPVKKNYRALKPEGLPNLIKALDSGKITPMVVSCIYFQLLTLARPGEASGAVWAEIDFENKLWTIPAERMKKRKEHTVPLSDHALEILAEIKKHNFSDEFIFVGRNGIKPINKESARMAFQRLEINTTAHGLRALASTVLNESGIFRGEVIEIALAHVEQSKSRAAYNRAEYLEERREMLIWWANLVYSHK